MASSPSAVALLGLCIDLERGRHVHMGDLVVIGQQHPECHRAAPSLVPQLFGGGVGTVVRDERRHQETTAVPGPRLQASAH